MKKEIFCQNSISWLLFVLVIGMFLLFGTFANDTNGCQPPSPTCPPCQHWDGSKCVGCQECSCFWCDTSIPKCKSKCDPTKCQQCTYDSLGNCTGCKVCGDWPCWECVGGECKFCGGRPCEVCSNGTCTPVTIKSQTLAEIPSDTTRTTIGIGEAVFCYTDPPAVVHWEHTGDGLIFRYDGPVTYYYVLLSPAVHVFMRRLGQMNVIR